MSEKKTSVEGIDRPLDLANRADLMAEKLESWAHRVAEWILDQSVETEPDAKQKLPIVMGLQECLPMEDRTLLEDYLLGHRPEVGKSLAEECSALVAAGVNMLRGWNAGAFFLFVNGVTGGARKVACKLRNAATMIRGEHELTERQKEPSPLACEAYRISLAMGWTQTDIAKALSKEHKRKIGQAQVSRWIAEVREYVEAGNVLPDLPQTGVKASVVTTDPAKLDYLDNPDGKVREKKSPHQYDGDE